MLNPNPARRRARQSVSLALAASLYLSALAGVLPFYHSTARAQTPVSGDNLPQPFVAVIAPGSAYRQTNLISDIPGLSPVLDPLLVNPWGISMTSSSPFWVANNGTSTTQLLRGDVGGIPFFLNPSPQTVTIPGGLPTGTVANAGGATDFVVTSGAASGKAAFLFASITGNITGWNPNVPAAGSTQAVIMASNPGHVYTGLAFGNNGTANFLYAADFANGKIDVFDKNFALQPSASFPFADPTIPNTSGNTYHPFNIQAVGGSLYVAYAKVGTDGHDEEGVGNGFVRRFNTNGVRDLTFGINNGPLNSPWGITLAPATFGIFGGGLLVGNFGEGNPSIHAFNPTTGAFLGTLQNEAGDGIEIDELWALAFGNGGSGGDVNTLYFTSGIGEEEHGLFGKLNPTTATATSLIQFSTDDFAINEGSGHIDVTVTRAGDASGTATVNFNTYDESQPGHASQKNDYEIALGTISFLPGETSKTVRILIVDDKFVEGDETINLALTNPTGAGVGLGSPNSVDLKIIDNDVAPSIPNPIDDPAFFVRQHYLDFFNREPDANAAALVAQITACGSDTTCINTRRREISTSFFNSPDFMGNGALISQTYRAAFGPNALGGSPAPAFYGNFENDLQAILNGVAIGAPADPQLEANKVAYFNRFVTRPEFVSKYPSTLTNAQYVDNLLATANLTPAELRLFLVSLTNSQEVPPTTPTTTGGAPRPASFGSARLQLNAAQTAMTLSATINNLDFTGTQTPDTNDNLLNAHIHAGASVAPGVNGPVVWGFIGSPFNDNNPNDARVTPFTSGVGGTVTGKWDAPEGNGTTLAAQLNNLRTGHAYINFHTTQFGGGEIRGNFPSVTDVRDSLVAALDASTLTRAQVLRKVAEQEELRQRDASISAAELGYFAYLRRDPDTGSFNSLLNRLNSFNGDITQANLVRIFLTDAEYRNRFGTDPTHAFTNNAPVANGDSANTNSITPVNIDVLANDTDPDGDNLTITSVTAGTGGTAAISADGRSVRFTPAPGFAGAASFQYTVTDNGFSCSDAVNGCGTAVTPAPLTASTNVNVNVTSAGTFQLGAASVSVAEGAGKVSLTVTLAGGSTTPVTVDYATPPDVGVVNCATVSGHASERCDFNSTVGTLRFAPGETSKTIDIFITDDGYVEGNETFTVTLSNPTGGATFTLGSTAVETVTITDNDAAPPATNPIDNSSFFIRQQYVDFLVREPDAGGLAFYLNILNGCLPSDIECTKYTRGALAANFFRSPEFQRKGSFVMYLYMVSLGQRPTTVAELSDPNKIERPHYTEFEADLQSISDPNDDQAIVSAKKDALTVAWLQRPEIVARYGSLTNAQFVQKLSDTAGVTLANQAQLVTDLNASTKTKAQVLRIFAESAEVDAKFHKQAFVTMEYFGYLRRDPEDCHLPQNWFGTDPNGCGYIFHNNRFKLAADKDLLENIIVRGFIESPEYRSRFGAN
ncbi:MAG: TIGR03118 family protein [Pyrinomonadaceae bacterium]